MTKIDVRTAVTNDHTKTKLIVEAFKPLTRVVSGHTRLITWWFSCPGPRQCLHPCFLGDKELENKSYEDKIEKGIMAEAKQLPSQDKKIYYDY